MSRRFSWPVIPCGLLAVICLFPGPALGRDDTATFIRKFLDVSASTAPTGRQRLEMTSLRAFYDKRDYKPVWSLEGLAAHGARTALAVLNTAASHGLDRDDYGAQKIPLPLDRVTSIQRAQMDIQLSKGLARYGVALGGHSRVQKSGAKSHGKPATRHKFYGLLQKATASKDLPAFFESLAPRSPRYRRLRAALADYREIARRGGWPRLPEGPSLRRGMRNNRVSVLQQRLFATGDLKAGVNGGDRFDVKTEAAVRRFQRRHGLTEDGIVGPRTRAALNVPVDQRLQQIRVNLERRRSMPDDLGSHYIFVNMADFVLKVVRDERTVLTMRVVVGTPYRQTPLFTATMTYIDFNPYWNIPRRIAAEEIVPRARGDASYLSGRGIRIFSGWSAQAVELSPRAINWRAVDRKPFPYRLRQDPGPLNPLGRVKFMFPNSFEVYLHDTPARRLFSRNVRTFSHGCIRVEKPAALAAHLLPALSGSELEGVLSSGKRRIFRFAKPVPVHLTYLTAWVNKDRSVHFRRDVYNRDKLLAAALR